MSQLIERGQEGDRQLGHSRITVFDMTPDESREGLSSAPTPETTHSRSANLIARAAKNKIGRFLAALPFFGGAAVVGGNIAMEAAKAFAEGANNRVESPLQAGELTQEFKAISVTKEEARANPVKPLALTAVERGNGNLIYMVTRFEDGQGDWKYVLHKSAPDLNGFSQSWEDLHLPTDFKTVDSVSAWGDYVVIGGQDRDYKAKAVFSSDLGKTLEEVPLPEDTTEETTNVSKVVFSEDVFFINVRTFEQQVSLYIFDPQQKKIIPVPNGGVANADKPVIGPRTQGSLRAILFSLALEPGGTSGGVLRSDIDVYRGEGEFKILAPELGSVNYVNTKRDQNNVITHLDVLQRRNSMRFKLNPDTGEVLNPGEASYLNWLRDKYPDPNDRPNLASSLDIIPTHEMFAGSINVGSGDRAVFIAREIETGKQISYVFDPDYSDGLSQLVPLKIGNKKRLVAQGELVRVISLNDDGTPIETNNPEYVYLGFKKFEITPTPTQKPPVPTNTASPTEKPAEPTVAGTASPTTEPAPSSTPSPTEKPVEPTVTGTVPPTSSPTSSPTASPTKESTPVGQEPKKRVFLPLTSKNKQGS